MRPMDGRDEHPAVIDARLREAAERGEPLELILVLRGKVRPAWGSGTISVRPASVTDGA